MILLFLKEVHMDKSEYNLRGMGITKTISVSLFNFFSLFLEMFLGKQWGHRCLVKKKNLEVPRSKGWIGLKMNPCFLNIRNKRGFHKLLLLFFWLCAYYSPFWWASRQKWLFQMIWQLEWCCRKHCGNSGRKLYPDITTRKKRTGKPWAETRPDKQTVAKSYKSWNAKPMIFNAVKVLKEERIILEAIVILNCLRCLLDIGQATHVSPKTITGLDRQGMAI